MKLNDLTLILVIGISIGIVSVLTKVLANTTESHPIEIVIAHYSISIIIALLFLTFILNKSIKDAIQSFTPKDFSLCIVISFIMVLTAWCSFSLLQRHSNTTVGPLNACLGLIFAVVLSAIFLNDRPSYTKLGGIIILMIGFFMVLNGDKEMKSYISKSLK
jgi:drug/metabolite transporter (DMT)-like permease